MELEGIILGVSDLWFFSSEVQKDKWVKEC